MSIAEIRKDYLKSSLSEDDVAVDPFTQFSKWWEEAINAHIEEVNAMTLATSTANGIPSARIVLLKGFDENGFVFYTNYTSRKGNEIEENPNVALLFFWKELERQVRIVGRIHKLDVATSDAYFNSRPEGSKIGAWASEQSAAIENREIMEEKVAVIEEKFKSVSMYRPEFWGGYFVVPNSMEFWQ